MRHLVHVLPHALSTMSQQAESSQMACFAESKFCMQYAFWQVLHLVDFLPHTGGDADQVVVTQTLEEGQAPDKLEGTCSRSMPHHKLHQARPLLFNCIIETTFTGACLSSVLEQLRCCSNKIACYVWFDEVRQTSCKAMQQAEELQC